MFSHNLYLAFRRLDPPELAGGGHVTTRLDGMDRGVSLSNAFHVSYNIEPQFQLIIETSSGLCHEV